MQRTESLHKPSWYLLHGLFWVRCKGNWVFISMLVTVSLAGCTADMIIPLLNVLSLVDALVQAQYFNTAHWDVQLATACWLFSKILPDWHCIQCVGAGGSGETNQSKEELFLRDLWHWLTVAMSTYLPSDCRYITCLVACACTAASVRQCQCWLTWW